ncbi:hypothetical protein JQK87_10425 [Streptomyces sp. G44]|uniref:hypothetical protein n=1 Tax=Streptomyces sp. G44 TaxID=2807632 RepID=UPI001961551D|nr:hypothetical protein [Streptomyces sp. G44]MBM7168821.1 hypothetical protein [Streptomyces sp. G44]
MRAPVVCRALLAAGIVTVAGVSALGLSLTPVAAAPTAVVVKADEPPPAKFSAAPEPDTQTAPPPPEAPKPKPPEVDKKSPVPSPPGTDPCSPEGINGIPSSESCKGVGKNQAANDKCQVENFHACSRPITGDAQDAQKKDQDAYVQDQADFENVSRSASPEDGAAQQCGATSGMRDRLSDDQVIVPHSSWWAC